MYLANTRKKESAPLAINHPATINGGMGYILFNLLIFNPQLLFQKVGIKSTKFNANTLRRKLSLD